MQSKRHHVVFSLNFKIGQPTAISISSHRALPLVWLYVTVKLVRNHDLWSLFTFAPKWVSFPKQELFSSVNIAYFAYVGKNNDSIVSFAVVVLPCPTSCEVQTLIRRDIKNLIKRLITLNNVGQVLFALSKLFKTPLLAITSWIHPAISLLKTIMETAHV